jgi:predicted ATPase
LIGDRDTLMVVDGCGARRHADARLLRLLQRCPGLRIVTTGLAPRHLIGEQIVPLAGLPVPAKAFDRDVSGLAAFAAVEVLAAQIRRFRPEFRLTAATAPGVAELCRRLDGVPKALELVADWCLVHSPEQLLTDPPAQVIACAADDDGPNLRESVRRTVGLLDPALRALLAHLERLPGSFSVAGAASSVGRSAFDLGRALHTLLVLGLLRVSDEDADRFQVLNLVRLARTEGRGGWTTLEAIA